VSRSPILPLAIAALAVFVLLPGAKACKDDARKGGHAASSGKQTARKAHVDHTPRHGGTFFMAPNGRIHLEGVYVRPGVVKVYFYDEYAEPLPAVLFKAEMAPRLPGAVKRVALKLADDGTLAAPLSSPSPAVAVDVWITFPAMSGGVK